ncbi:leucine-rich repeat domain-containing protein [Mycoplasma sp. 1654_15]|uniref:leucine-rich repeat domain-containing protein n=1 Tax=Mycoplasma sp. 1654_15 TaxID=2725994 RepID=UPI0014492F37|nr:leucine-rich repeat domain-containing protein [Mycoplasma sp. 1654_15]QJB71518.1 leucine-rich repeat protein [Mycoplasma sp. 1654_15]
MKKKQLILLSALVFVFPTTVLLSCETTTTNQPTPKPEPKPEPKPQPKPQPEPIIRRNQNSNTGSPNTTVVKPITAKPEKTQESENNNRINPPKTDTKSPVKSEENKKPVTPEENPSKMKENEANPLTKNKAIKTVENLLNKAKDNPLVQTAVEKAVNKVVNKTVDKIVEKVKKVFKKEEANKFTNKYIRGGDGNKYVKLETDYGYWEKDLNYKKDSRYNDENYKYSLFSRNQNSAPDFGRGTIYLDNKDFSNYYYRNDENTLKFKMFTLDLSSTNITEIPEFAFSTWESRTVTITDKNEKTTYYLGNVIFPNTLKTIKEKAFYLDKKNFEKEEQFIKLQKIPLQFQWENLISRNDQFQDYGDSDIGLTTIGESAFENNTMPWLMLPRSLKTIEDNAFKNANIYKISWLNWIDNGYSNRDDWNKLQISKIGKYAFANNKLGTSLYTYGYSNRSYYGSNSVNTLNLQIDPRYLKEISEGAFINNKLQNIIFSNEKTEDYSSATDFTVDKLAFANNNISEIEFPEYLKNLTIKEQAFIDNKIEEITLPKTKDVKITINSKAFAKNPVQKVNTYEDNRIKIVDIFNTETKTVNVPKWMTKNSQIDKKAFKE